MLCVFNVYGKSGWVVFLKDKKVITITNAFQQFLEESNRNKKMWIDKSSKFYRRSMKLWLHDTGIVIYSVHKERKYNDVERFVRTLKKKIWFQYQKFVY